MTDDTPSCDKPSGNQTMSFETALERVLQSTEIIKTHRNVDLREALDCVLAENIASPIDVPPFINSAMDGYAVAGGDLSVSGETRLKVIGKSFAGHPFENRVNEGECVRIMTGAVMPEGTDTVVMQEHVKVDGNHIKVGTGYVKGQNVRHPGDDFNRGEVIVRAGERLTPTKLGLLASVGISQLNVIRTPVVAFFSTGDELKGMGESLQAGDIYDSNRYILFGMLEKMGMQSIDMGVIADVREQIELALKEAAACADVVITSGGASVGEADYIKEILDGIGEVDFWKIAMKPGKPLAFGKIGKTLFFGLPGNPVSAMTTFYQFVQPCLRRLEGEKPRASITLKATCLSPLNKHPGRKDFQRGVLSTDPNGRLVVDTTGTQGSHMLSSMAQANCFIALAREDGNIEAGTQVEIQLFNDLI